MAKGMSGMMKQVQKMQKKMMQLQEGLADQRVEGTAGGGMVVAVVDGKLNVVEIRPPNQSFCPAVPSLRSLAPKIAGLTLIESLSLFMIKPIYKLLVIIQ